LTIGRAFCALLNHLWPVMRPAHTPAKYGAEGGDPDCTEGKVKE